MAKVLHRLEGPGKVAGHKLFASDLRPRDFEGWGSKCAHVMLVRSAFYDRVFERLDLAVLPPEARPAKFLDANEMIAGLSLTVSGSPKDAEKLFAIPGKLPDILGQPVGLAFYDDYLSFFAGALELRQSFDSHVYGAPTSRGVPSSLAEDLAAWRSLATLGPSYSETHFVRDLDQNGEVLFSQVKNGRHKPMDFSAGNAAAVNAEARERYFEIRALLDNPRASQLKVVSHTSTTQCVDPMFLEPEAGLGWRDKNDVLHLVLGTQSPEKDRRVISDMFANAAEKPSAINIISQDCGGGFGGRDASVFPQYLALAAFHSEVPVRLAFDRYEQFQSGLKRHASAVSARLAVTDTGQFAAIQSHVVFEGGGQKNLTSAVTSLGTLHAGGPYATPRSSLHGVATSKPGPIVGSMRGFGIPQVAFNIEVLVDRLAVALDRDALDLRMANLLNQNAIDAAGVKLRFHLANAEILKAASAEALWVRRDAYRAARSTGDIRYGVGFACCMEAYGTSQDGALAGVGLAADGTITLWSEAVDMGQGARTALQLSTVAFLGQAADVVMMGQIEPFERLKLSTESTADANPRYTPSIWSTSSASKTAFFHVHVAEQAALILWKCALAPAARALGVPETIDDDALMACWDDGILKIKGGPELSLAQLAGKAHELDLPISALAHGYFYDGWTAAQFVVDDRTLDLFIDGLAVERPDTGWSLLDRVAGSVRRQTQPGMPRTLYASGGHVLGVEVNIRSGQVRVVDAISIVDSGDPIHNELLAGQIEGGLAMGISHALFEALPSDVGRPRTTNLDTYRIARAVDVPHGKHHKQVLIGLGNDSITGPGQPRTRRKGVGEVTMTTVGPAIANAVAHALDHQFWPTALPIRRTDILERKGAGRATL